MTQDDTAKGDDGPGYFRENLHPHPLILHKIDDGSCVSVCNACVQSVSPPFYGCSRCPDFFLHASCAHLPTQIEHRVHKQHPLSLYPKAPKSDITTRFCCKGCGLWCNGFAYSCETCHNDFTLDVVCAMINPAITHESHKNTHILFMSPTLQHGRPRREKGIFFNSSGSDAIVYECSICPNFELHVRFALLPNTARHIMFDPHPLHLTTTQAAGSNDEFCEVCEKLIDKKDWYYSCSQCSQSFHVRCIPSVGELSKIKMGSTLRVEGHGCPLVLVPQDDAVCRGRRCGSCGKVDDSRHDGLLYECSNCFFVLHRRCAEEKSPFLCI